MDVTKKGLSLKRIKKAYKEMGPQLRERYYLTLIGESRLESTQGLITRFLFEQGEDEDDESEEEEEPDEGESDDDLFGDDADAEGGGGIFGDDDPDEETDSEENEEDDSEKEDKIEKAIIDISTEDEIRLKDSLDAELEAALTDFEVRAMKSAVIEKEGKGIEEVVQKRAGISQYLFEQEDDEEVEVNFSNFDIDQFASDVSRLIKNYDTLIDMEAIIYAKARKFLADKYGSEAVESYDDVMTTRHGIDIGDEKRTQPPDSVGPYAIGAFGSSGGGGGGI